MRKGWKYRIVYDWFIYGNFVAEGRPWWWPFWWFELGGTNTYPEIELARERIANHGLPKIKRQTKKSGRFIKVVVEKVPNET